MPIRDWRELQNMVDQKQAGTADSFEDLEYLSPEDDIQIDFDIPEEDKEREAHNRRLEAVLAGQTAAERMQDLDDTRNRQLQQLYELENQINNSASDYGYGDYRKDTEIPYDEWRKNPFDARANAQTPLAKLANGAAKMLPYAATTFLDDTVGLVAGILNVGVDALNGGEFRPGRSFINTPFANYMQKVRDWSEEALPNYRTEEEILDADHWWKHMNANFWGDTFLKNLGFTIGAGASALLYGEAFNSATKGAARKAHRAAISAASGDSASINGFRRIISGDAMQNPQAVNGILEKMAETTKRLGPVGMMVAGTSGAIGESRVEALQAAKEFRESQNMKDSVEYNKRLSELAASIADTEEFIDGYDENGLPVLNDLGRAAFQEGQKDINNEFAERQGMVDDQAYALANTTFWLNMPLLTASNMIMFGKLMSGGFKTQSRAAIKGALGKRTGKQTVAGAIAKGFVTPISEGTEELSQKIISEGAKDVASANAAAFNNRKYDKNAIKSVSEWMSSMLNSAGNVLVNPQSWQEFAIGALTGAIGPGGKSRVGGMYASIKEGLEQVKEDKKTADDINELENSDRFHSLLDGLVRNVKLENIKDEALKHKDEFVWHTAEDEKLINAVMMYDKAGALDELEDIVDSYATLSEDELPNISSLLSDETKKDFNRRSKKQRLEWLHKQGEKVKDTIHQYRDAYNSLDYLAYGTSSEDAIKELIYTKVQLKNFENRYNSILEDVLGRITPSLEYISQQTDKTGEPTEAAKQAIDLLQSESKLRSLFGSDALDYTARADENPNDVVAKEVLAIDADKQQEVLDVLGDWIKISDNDNVTVDEIKDLQKLVRARGEFYGKIFYPDNRKTFEERFNENAQNPEDVADNIAGEQEQDELNAALTDLKSSENRDQFISKYTSLVSSKNDDFLNTVLQEAGKDKKLSEYIEYIGGVETFFFGLSNKVNDLQGKVDSPEERDALASLQDIIEEIDPLDIVTSTDDESDPELTAATYMLKLLEEDQSPISDYYKNILVDHYDRIAKAKGLGKVEPRKTEKDLSFDVVSNSDGSISAQSKSGNNVKSNSIKYEELEGLGLTPEDLGQSVINETNPEEQDSVPNPSDSISIDSVSITPDGDLSVIVSSNGKKIELGNGVGDPAKVLIAIEPELAEKLGINTEGKQSDFDNAFNFIDTTVDINNSILNALAGGDFSSFNNLSDDEKFRIQQEAINKISELDDSTKEQPDDTGQDRLNPESDPTTPEARAFGGVRKITISGTPFTNYDIGSSKKGKKKLNTDPKNIATIKWLRSHNVPSFVDSGALAHLYKAKEAKGEKLPIYFIANPHNIKNNPDINPFAYNKGIEVVLAVEIDDDARITLSDFAGRTFSEDGLLDIDGKKYQVVGHIKQPTKEDADAAKKKGDNSLWDIKENEQLIWREAVDRSIKPQYEKDGGISSMAIPEEGKWYVAYDTNYEQKGDEEPDLKSGNRLYTTLAYIQSGRNFTDPELNGKGEIESYRKTPLAVSLEKYDELKKRRHFYLHTVNSVAVTPGFREIPDDSIVHCPDGSLWMATEASNGKLSWNYVTVPTFDEYASDPNFGLSNYRSSDLIQRLYDSIDAILSKVNPDMTSEERKEDTRIRLNAIKFLTDLFYVGKDNHIILEFVNNDFTGNGVRLYVGGVECATTEEVINTLKDKRIRFNVNASDVLDKDQTRIKELIDAGILRSEMQSFERFNSNIGINMVSNKDENGNEVGSIYPVEAPVPFTAFTDGDIEISGRYKSGEGMQNIPIGDKSYRIDEQGVVRVMTTRGRIGSIVDNKIVIAEVKALSELLSPTSKFSGKHWAVSEEGYMYSDLYESEINGIKVRMAREGKNNNVHILFSNDLWDSYMTIAKEVKPKLHSEAKKEKPVTKKDIAAAEKKFDNVEREDTTHETETRTISTDNADDYNPSDYSDYAPTVQDLERDEDTEEAEDDCNTGF